jgi:lytic murein transglycosylase
MLRLITLAAGLGLAFGASVADAACPSPSGFPKWLKAVKAEAFEAGVSEAAWEAASPYLNFDASIVKRDRSQGVFSQTFLDFSARMVNDARIKRGAALIKKNKSLFQKIEKKYGVPAPVLVAFWGLETDFGGNIGDLPVITSLATLAYDCRRPEKFRPQLIAALQLIDSGDLSVEEMRGAWAGEVGQTQFMPGDYLEKAVDFDGDGKRDLRGSAADVLASTANFMRLAGWQPGQPWLEEVRVPAELPWDQADLAIRHPRSQWAEWGVEMADGEAVPADNVPVALLLPMGRKGPAFFAHKNFQAYIKWNESLVYSTSAAYLAARLGGAQPLNAGKAPPFGFKQIAELQKLLSARGFDVGKIDGKLGAGTRAAVKKMQMEFGLPADSWPTVELLKLLKLGHNAESDGAATGTL